MDILVERHYVAMGERTTENLSGVISEVDVSDYERMISRTSVICHAAERNLGNVEDSTRYYNFTGVCAFLSHGLVQFGKAVTADNQEGFRMARLFANSLDEMALLELESGLRQ